MPSQDLFAEQALLPEGWASNVRIGIDHGRIASISSGSAPEPGDIAYGAVVPGMPNLHSHAFQRGMAGLAEVRGKSADTFWTWREIMYRFALSISPEQMEAIASQAYVEMLESGFTRVGEFHYLHHDQSGLPYADIAEMSGRIAAASRSTGIGLTLLPAFYAHANFGGIAPTDGQRRFICTLDSYALLLDRCRQIVGNLETGVLGVAPHSLRAVTPDELAVVIEYSSDGPIHLHIAEQEQEVEDCISWSGQRPIAWLLDRFAIDDRWCLIHATHIDAEETGRLAASGAVAGLCPITEANLGDGIFPGAEFTSGGGRYGIGTDSNVLIGVAHELRQFEYAQRLRNRRRNVLANGPGSTGRALFDSASGSGARALGASSAGVAIGAPADIVTLRHETLKGDTILDGWIFANSALVEDVWVAGKRVVEQGRHVHRDTIASAFRSTMRELTANLSGSVKHL